MVEKIIIIKRMQRIARLTLAWRPSGLKVGRKIRTTTAGEGPRPELRKGKVC